MTNYKIGCDAHRRFSQFAILDADGQFLQQVRVNHEPGAIQKFLSAYPPGTPVALESVGNWYCLHLWCGTGGSSTRSKPPAVFRSWLMQPKPK
ncbi:MAG: hypothetical protein GTO14_03740 [Anaerolineales bacterium]|nr:hypothetical protein [Anaerolineales bacterium]